MAKFGKLPTKTYNIYHFNFSKLIEYGKIKNNILEVDIENSRKSYKIIKNNPLYEGFDKKGNCQLFDQTLKVLNVADKEDIFEYVYVIIDFKDFINRKNKKIFVNTLLSIQNGIKLFVKNKEIHVVDFLKSNTMSKDCCVMYVNKEILSSTNLEERTTFKLDNGNYILSKWYAYSGLSLSDATILHNIKFNEDEVVIIPDDEKERNIECITAASVNLIVELAIAYKDLINRIKNLDMYDDSLNYDKAIQISSEENSKFNDIKIFKSNIRNLEKVYNKLKCYRSSKDYDRILKSTEEKNYDDRQKIINVLDQALEIIKSNESFDTIYKKLGIFIEANKVNEDNEVYWENFKVTNFPVVINKFDGEGLITLDLAKQINEELNKNNKKKLPYGYTFQIRLPFIKGIVNSCNIQEFCNKHGITKIYGLSYDSNKLKEYDISKVKMILTESQFKCGKLLKNNGMSTSDFMRLLKEYDYSLGINHLEYDHENKVDLNAQVMSTIPFNQKELDHIIMFNDKEYKNDTSSDKLVNACIERYNSELEQEFYNNNAYYNFYMSTKRFKDFRSLTSKKLKTKYLKLKFKQYGYRRFLCGDCLELLYHAFYHHTDNKFNSYLSLYEFYAPKNQLPINEKCFILRNPHYSRNEIGVMRNSDQNNNEREKYFGHLSGVLMFNSLSLLADRLGGADFDGDSVIVVNAMFASKAIKELELKESKGKLRYPVINIPGLDSAPVAFNYPNKVKSLYNTFNSRVGMISNSAFCETFDIYKQDFDKHDRIALYTIINGLEIDSAKKGIKPMMLDGEKNDLAKAYIRIKDTELVGNKGLSKYSIRYIKEHADDHNIFYLMNASLDYEPSPKDKISRNKFKYDISKIDKSKLQKMIESYCIYLKLNEFIDKRKKYNIVFNDLMSNDALSNKIISIITKNHPNFILDDLNDFYSNIRDSIVDIKETLNKYCFEQNNKFHYMTDSDEKIDYITNVLKMDLSYDEIEILCDFNNDGYMLLYLVLNFLYNNYCREINQLAENPELTEYIEFINKKIIKNLDKKIKLSDSLIKEIATNVKNSCDEFKNRILDVSINAAKVELYEALNIKLKDISIDHFLTFGQLNDSNIIFDLMSEQTKKYLDKHIGESNYEKERK